MEKPDDGGGEDLKYGPEMFRFDLKTVGKTKDKGRRNPFQGRLTCQPQSKERDGKNQYLRDQ